jgi:hypothetical protein
MEHIFTRASLATLAAGVATGALATAVALGTLPDFLGHSHDNDDYKNTEYHTHADLLIIVNDEKIDLSDDSFMTIATRILHPGVHLHDNDGDVIHFHAPGITLPTFLDSIGFTLSETCLETRDEEFCADDENVLKLYVNDEDRSIDIANYVPADEDRVLIYYGTEENTKLSSYLSAVTDDSCYFSGTCPERGIAPPESCGLFCEL